MYDKSTGVPAWTGTSYSWTNGRATFSPDDIGKVLDVMKQNP